MSQELPEFRTRPQDQVMSYASRAFTNPRGKNCLKRIIRYNDGHYRALFTPDYFMIQEGESEPTKSQWSTLKKHMKRIDRGVFIFKEHGETDCNEGKNVAPGTASQPCYYVDFGFFAH